MYYTYKTNQEILEELNDRVYGHEQAKKVLINLINRSRVRHYQKWLLMEKKENLIETGKCLLLGQSGTGKTYMLECLADILDFPLITLSATQLSPTGAGDGVKSSQLEKLISVKAMEYSERKKGYYFSQEGAMDQVVVFIDEVDKLGQSFESSGNWNKHVQSNFLTLFDNRKKFAGVSFIFAGAFDSIVNKKSKNSIGFNEQSGEDSLVDDDLAEQIVKAGMIPEIVGRLTAIVKLDQFSKEDYLDMLENNIIPKKIKDLRAFNIHQEDIFAKDRLKAIVDIAFKSEQGVRALKREVDKITLDLEFNYSKNKHSLIVYGE